MAAGAPVSGKRLRQQAILEIVARTPVGNQAELAELLRERGLTVTQATVSRDIADLSLVKVTRGGRPRYLSPDDLASTPGQEADRRLARLLAEIPVTVGRSGLILVLRGPAGSAQALAQAIDRSTLQEQEGTLGGDDTILVLFADQARLERWLDRFQRLQP
ncbi:MAG: arginine repressor [Chloroflexota bacterium]|nr:MAG: arginine repressor [Chloroflexota bacterium]